MDESLLLHLKNLYQLQNPQFWKNSEHGYSNVNFYITDGDTRYFVKAYSAYFTESELRVIHKAHFFYHRHGIPAIVPLCTRAGTSFFTYNNRFYALFQYREEKIIDAPPNERMVSSMGAMLARIHRIGMHNWAVVHQRKFLGWPDAEKETSDLIKILTALPEQTELDQRMREFVEYKQSIVRAHPIRFKDLQFKNNCIIHGDFHLYNVFFHEDDTVAYVFDFDRVMRGPRATEIIYSLFLICFDFSEPCTDEVRERQFYLAKVFLEAYQELFPISRDELEKGISWYFFGDLARTHWIESQHYIWHSPRAHLLLAERFNRVRYISEHISEIKERLLAYSDLGPTGEAHTTKRSWRHKLFSLVGMAHRADESPDIASDGG